MRVGYCLALAVELISIGACASLSPQVYFNHNSDSQFTEPYREITRKGDDLESLIVAAILSAQKSVHLAIYDLRLPKVALALVELQRRSPLISVQIVVDNTNRKSWSEYTPKEVSELSPHDRASYNEGIALIDQDRNGVLSTEEILTRDAMAILKQGGISVIDDTADGSRGSGLMHHKFMIVDGSFVWTGSSNFTMSCLQGDLLKPLTRGNANHWAVFESVELAQVFETEFLEMWKYHHFGLKKKVRPPFKVKMGSTEIEGHFSPVSEKRFGWEATTNGWLEGILKHATQGIDMALFVFSEQRLVDAVQVAAVGGARVRALIEPGFAFRNYSELLDLWGLELLDSKCRIEKGNHPWAVPIKEGGIPEMPDGDVFHHKFAIIDNNRVIFGSHNWSEAANTDNDEVLLSVKDPEFVKAFTAEFDRWIQTAQLGPPQWLLKRISDQLTFCKIPGQKYQAN